MFDEQSFSLSPVNFFQISGNCQRLNAGNFPQLTARNVEKFFLPDTSVLCHEKRFADVALGWNEEGIECLINVKDPVSLIAYPDVTQGDSVELFIDTRDVKTSGFNTRFCHHFFFLPEPFEGMMAGEITRFRTEDTHELCDGNDLQVKAQVKKNGYILNIFIPAQCLNGYDPEQFNRIGFTYRINRYNGQPQHFSVVSSEYQLEQQPSLWSSLNLTK
ncbi:MAG: hypothetical protein H0X51_02505 [Parachlamydiaceae bacterium]|nr:hypothetical protein [Parachlamydiaceae bacterium]